jgi:two-component system, NarL family, nitrate/nitrite response regulator NarL
MMRDDSAERFIVAIGRPAGPTGGVVERWLAMAFDVVPLSGPSDMPSAPSGAEVVVVEVPEQSGDVIELVQRLKADSKRPVLVVGPDLPDDVVLELLRLDVEGLVIAPDRPEAIADCVRQVRSGWLCLDPHIIRRAAKALLLRTAALRELEQALTGRQIEIARLVARGLTNKEIAGRLFIAGGTLKVHLHKIFERLQVRSRKELASYMQQRGLP